MMKTFRRRGNRIRPLIDIHGQWLTQYSTYPEITSVAMRDGRVVRYVIDAKPVRLHLGRNGWEKTGYQMIGYQYRTEKKKPMKQVTSLLHRVMQP
jgi:hypothetical protein